MDSDGDQAASVAMSRLLLQLRHNVVCCHGNDGRPRGDARERTAGTGNVQVTVREGLLRVNPMLKKTTMKSVQVQ